MHSKRELGQFYTPADVAKALVALVAAEPSDVLDIGCGHGSLSKAAIARWGGSTNLTTMDIDPEAHGQGEPWSDDHRHFQCNVLDTTAFDYIIGRKRFDLVLLNPPYGRCELSAIQNSQNKGERSAPHIIRCRSTIFMLKALSAVRIGGTVAAILPETIAVGAGYIANRRAISALGEVQRIVRLPTNTFSGTEARTVMIIFQRCASRDGDPATWSETHLKIQDGTVPRATSSTIGELGVNVVRGRLNAREARDVGAFHLGAFKSAKDGVIDLSDDGNFHDDRSADVGDILVARIGRNISEKVVLVGAGSNTISDCVFRLRCAPSVSERVWSGLRSVQGKRQLEASLSGVTTRLLPLRNLLNLRV